MPSEKLVAALDIGSTKIVALVGEVDEQGGIYVIGHGEAPAEGLRRGIVVNMEKTVHSIRKAINDAQMVSGTEIDKVTAGIAGEHVRSINSHGVIAVSRTDNEITASDVNRAIEAAEEVGGSIKGKANLSIEQQGIARVLCCCHPVTHWANTLIFTSTFPLTALE